MAGESKRISKEELREDEIAEWIMLAIEYVRERAQYFIGGVAGFILLIFLINLFISKQEEAKLRAAERLGDMVIAEAGGESGRALQLNEQLLEEFEGTPAASKGILLLANRYYRQGRYADAQGLYQRYLKEDAPLDVFELAAWNGLAACLAAQGQFQQAAQKYQAYADAHSSAQPAALALQQAARYYALADDTDSQKRVLERILKDFSRSPVAAKAREDLGML